MVHESAFVYHITHISNLASIANLGLLCATQHRETTSISNRAIKARRSARQVPVSPYGRVDEYVPFYFAPRSPMLYAVHCGYQTHYSGTGGIVHLVVKLTDCLNLDWVASDRNAALRSAKFTNAAGALDTHVDWALMRPELWRLRSTAQFHDDWHNTSEYPDRKERRCAEFLIYDSLPWSFMVGVVAKHPRDLNSARKELAHAQLSGVHFDVRRHWYF